MKVGDLVVKRIVVEAPDGFIIEDDLLGIIIAHDMYFHYCDIFLVYFVDGTSNWYNEFNLKIILDNI